jgi:hypothetical protein
MSFNIYIYIYIEKENESFNWVVNTSQCIYNPSTLSSLGGEKRLESHLFFMTLTRNKYHLHIINILLMRRKI